MRQEILGNLDLPFDDVSESSPLLRVAGWAWSRSGIERIDMCVDGEVVSTTNTGQHRPDVVASMAGDPGLATSGFQADVLIRDVADGSHEFSAVVRDRAGRTRFFKRRFDRISAESFYHSYYERALPTPQEVADADRTVSATKQPPRLSLLIDGESDGDIAETVRSLRGQGYEATRWVVLCGDDRRSWVTEHLADLEQDIGAVAFEFSPSAAVDHSTDGAPSFVAFLHPGESLAPNALALVAARAVDPGASVIYSDHDVVLPTGRHIHPSFKPDWSPDHLLSRDYIGPSYFVRHTERLRDLLTHMPAERGPGWRFDLLLRLTDEPTGVVHIPRVLWSLPSDRHDAEQEAQKQVAAVTGAIERRGHRATVAATERPGIRRVRWEVSERPKVSIIIPTTGRIDYLRPCLESLRARTRYDNYEVLIIDNGRGNNRDGIDYVRSLGLTVLTRDEPFNWAKLNNDGARATDGALLLFLNDDVEIVDDDWLTELVSQATRPDVGAVGCLLLYPDGRIQHAGVVLVRHGGGAMHLFQGQDPKGDLYLDLQAVTREVSASTGACLMVSRERFDEAGGFDEELAIVGNDVDLCLRLARNGYRNIWTPHSVLVHHESVSRGPVAISADERAIWDRWGDLLQRGDPYYNENLDPRRADCSIDWSRVKKVSQSAGVSPSRGVNWIGYIRAEMGLGEAARGYARSMQEAGIPFTLIDVHHDSAARMGDDSWLHKVTFDAPYDTTLLHVNASNIRAVAAALPHEIMSDRYIIGYWAWEMPEFPDEWLPAFDVVNEVWVPSSFVRETVSHKSPVPVIRIPHAVPIRPGPFHPRAHFGFSQSTYQFLTMYDVHSVRERKNPEGVVRAFKEAFDPHDGRATLVIKVNAAGTADGHVPGEWTKGYPNIHVLSQILSRHEVDSLIATSDCFVSLHRSEGFGLPIAEAMGLGKPVIATNWSGNVDFMTTKNAVCIDYELIELDRDYGPYRAGQVWAEPDVRQAAWWMDRLAAEPSIGTSLGDAARQHVESQLSPAVIGALMKRRLGYLNRGPGIGRSSQSPGVVTDR